MNMIKELKHWKTDVPSGLVVFLVAIPLCLGIALASGAPAISGVIAGIVGGLVVTLFSNSSLGVSGPAAGLVAIVVPAIEHLGFQNFLLAVVLSGVIQFLLGIFKAGTIGYYFPTAVIKGMLVAIGLIIILKQIPHAFGYDKDSEGDLAFQQADGHNTFSEIYHAILHPNISAFIVSVVCLAILIFWQSKFMKKFSFTKVIQGPLIAVIAGIIIGLGFHASDSMQLTKNHMVSLPDGSDTKQVNLVVGGDEVTGKASAIRTAPGERADGNVFDNVKLNVEPNAVLLEKPANGKVDLSPDGTFAYTPNEGYIGSDMFVFEYDSPLSLTFPHFAPAEVVTGEAGSAEERDGTQAAATMSTALWSILLTALTIAIVASLESLLCAEATDKLDAQRRQTDLNRELRAQGIGNFVSGMIGGLPVTQVIVRSSTNIQSGAQSRLAAFVHGIFLIVCVLAIPQILNMIPLASLAAILFIVGYNLAHPRKFVGMYKLGWAQFLPFVITIIAILATDLLIGIGIGLVASIFFILKNNYVKSFWMKTTEEDGTKIYNMTLAENVFFLNKGSLQNALQEIEPGSKVFIDASDTVHIDQDVIDLFKDFETHAQFKDIEFVRVDFFNEVKTTADPARVKRTAEAIP
ncbi:MAG: SulP family inorganic anion transporter [Fuerstiella sp.]|nr:SulP family inorganic anion transporter [Fuerstiella sp.]